MIKDSVAQSCVWRALAALRPVWLRYVPGQVNRKIELHSDALNWDSAAPAGNGTQPAAGPGTATGRFVIMRGGIPNATDPNAMKPRFRGAQGGWTPDPRKVTPFESGPEAAAACKSSDKVVSLAKALKRAKV